MYRTILLYTVKKNMKMLLCIIILVFSSSVPGADCPPIPPCIPEKSPGQPTAVIPRNVPPQGVIQEIDISKLILFPMMICHINPYDILNYVNETSNNPESSSDDKIKDLKERLDAQQKRLDTLWEKMKPNYNRYPKKDKDRSMNIFIS